MKVRFLLDEKAKNKGILRRLGPFQRTFFIQNSVGLLFGENIYQQISGHSLFQALTPYATNNPTTIPISFTDTVSLPTKSSTTLPGSTTSPVIGTSTSTFFPLPSIQTNTPDVNCDQAIFIDDVNVPDGTIFSPGQVFTKTWLLQNAGTCTWSQSYLVAFVSGEKMSGQDQNIPVSVPPGMQVNISVHLTAPVSIGTFQGMWRLKNPSGSYFGNIFTVLIKVK